MTDPCRFGDKPVPGNDFSVTIAEAQIVAPRDFLIPKYGAGNFIRGQWGKDLHQNDPDLYRHIFAPPRRSEGPSGLFDSPRPFVLRVRDWEGKQVQAGQKLRFRLHLFSSIKTISISPKQFLEFNLDHLSGVCELSLTFLSPTELKGGEPWNFASLLGRVRDRVSTLRSLYQGGPLALDFTKLGDEARKIEASFQDLSRIDRQRRSGTNQQLHPLSGWVGTVRFRGDLAPFLPLIQIAEYTGIGRHTVWGQGEIKIAWE
ncbi:MAG: CRISPR system precrRNA processing endoribonuclease RAMP protein Cas6 [Bryobacter sp.]|nr:CRISPR system precrRNA processing endoribonuclease RAMP protein Cas6 [Bryobacter sp.]